MKKIISFIIGLFLITDVSSAATEYEIKQSIIKLLYEQIAVLQKQIDEIIRQRQINPSIIFYVDGQYVEEKSGISFIDFRGGSHYIKSYLKNADYEDTKCSIEQTNIEKINIDGKFNLYETYPSLSFGSTNIKMTCSDTSGRETIGRLILNIGR